MCDVSCAVCLLVWWGKWREINMLATLRLPNNSQNVGNEWATEYTMTQCDTAAPLPRMTSCTRWVRTSSLSPCSSFLLSVPATTTGQPARKWQNNQRGNKDVRSDSWPYRFLTSNINTLKKILMIQVTDTDNQWILLHLSKHHSPMITNYFNNFKIFFMDLL